MRDFVPAFGSAVAAAGGAIVAFVVLLALAPSIPAFASLGIVLVGGLATGALVGSALKKRNRR